MKRDFTVTCREDERDELIEAAAYLDRQMQAITDTGQVLGVDRCAIMAGLNISHSLLQLQKSVDHQTAIDSRLQNLHDQVEKCVATLSSESE